jgi:two-component system response regulator RegA
MLVVDDDEVFRLRLARALASRGFEVRSAAGFDEAMALAAAESPELATIDLNMPGRSGLELVRALLAVDASTRIVVLTGYGSIATAVEAMRLGAVGYLSKPADADQIVAAFDRAEKPPMSATAEAFSAPSLARVEWEHIQRVMTDCGGNISEAARRLGLHRRSLQRKLLKAPVRR